MSIHTLLVYYFIGTTVCAAAIKLTMTSSPSPAAVPVGASVTLRCHFDPPPVYIFWRYASDKSAGWQSLALCHTELGACSIKAPFSAEWAAARPAVGINGSLTLRSVSGQQDGLFECEGIRGTDAAKANQSLAVLVAPNQPTLGSSSSPSSPVAEQTSVEGSPLALTCQCPGGNPPARIDWLRLSRGGAGIDSLMPADSARWSSPTTKFGASRSDLLVPASADYNGALLACRCVHPLANYTSTPVSLTVLYGPKVLPVSSQKVLLGDRVEFNCTADANPTSTVYIARGNSTVSAIGQRSVSHVIPSTSKADTGSYACVAQTSRPGGELQTRRQQFYLDVLYQPELSIKLLTVGLSTPAGTPISVASAKEGARLTIECSVSANPPPSAVWWRQSGGSPAGSNSSNVLQLDPVARSHAGQWICEAKSSAVTTATAGSGAGQPIRREFSARASVDIIVEYAPGQPEIRATVGSPVQAGRAASLVCQPGPAEPGVPVPEFIWSRYSVDSSGLIPLARSPVLQFNPVSLSDSGLYYCTPENSVGRGPAASVALEVVQAPSWLTTSPWPSVLTVNASSLGDGGLRLDCSTLAKPEALTRWFKDGVELPRSSRGSMKYTIEEGYDPARHISTGALKISELGPADNAEYLCTAQNGFGKIERSLRLVVEFTPVILTDTAKVALDPTLATSSGVSLECLVDSQPEPTVTWELLTSNDASDSQLVGNLVQESPPPYRYRASLPGVKRTGGYACRARNRIGESSHVIQVVNPGPPEPPTNLTILSTDWDHVLLAWQPGFDGGVPANYSVTFASLSDVKKFGVTSPHTGKVSIVSSLMTSLMRTLSMGSAMLTANVTELLPATVYSFTVSAKNSMGKSLAEPAANASTKQLQLPGVGGVRADTDAGTLSFSTPPDGLCIRVEVSTDGGSVWSPYRSCEVGNRLAGIRFTNAYRLFACLLARPNVCGPPVATQSSDCWAFR